MPNACHQLKGSWQEILAHSPVDALQLCVNEGGLELERVGPIGGRRVWDVGQAVSYPGVRFH